MPDDEGLPTPAKSLVAAEDQRIDWLPAGSWILYDLANTIYAAAITYFTIFALFPLLMMAFAVVGFVLASRPSLMAEIDSRVKAAVPADFANQVLTLMD